MALQNPGTVLPGTQTQLQGPSLLPVQLVSRAVVPAPEVLLTKLEGGVVPEHRGLVSWLGACRTWHGTQTRKQQAPMWLTHTQLTAGPRTQTVHQTHRLPDLGWAGGQLLGSAAAPPLAAGAGSRHRRRQHRCPRLLQSPGQCCATCRDSCVESVAIQTSTTRHWLIGQRQSSPDVQHGYPVCSSQSAACPMQNDDLALRFASQISQNFTVLDRKLDLKKDHLACVWLEATLPLQQLHLRSIAGEASSATSEPAPQQNRGRAGPVLNNSAHLALFFQYRR